MEIFSKSLDIENHVNSIKLHGKKIAFVPTMGNLHQGHIELVKKARLLADYVIVSIFINPKQFGPKEDFASYPRTLEQDFTMLKPFADAVFTPNENEIYPNPFHIKMDIPHITNCLCGTSRPHFFGGVMAVVMRLFLITSPHVAIFGEKDFQQFMVIREMVRSFGLKIDIIPMPIFREESGLASSSRNNYLTAENRKNAAAIYQTLMQIAKATHAGKDLYSEIEEAKRKIINAGFDKIDYLEVRSEEDLSLSNKGRIFFAGFIQGVRLIDNLVI